MKDFDLESRLRGERVPERPDEYWEDFPSCIRRQLGHKRTGSAPRAAWRPRLAWAGGFALAVALTFVSIDSHPWRLASTAFARNELNLRTQLAQMDTRLHRLILNTDGMGYLLNEPN